MSHIFISYSRADDDFALQLEMELEARGIDAWTDHDLEYGTNWKNDIDAAIRESFVVLVVMTPAAKSSEYVTFEWSYALGAGVTVIPLMLKDTLLHPKLTDVQYVNFTGDFDPPFKKLLRRLKELEITHLIKSLKNPHFNVRQKAVKRLGELKVKKAVPDLIRVLAYDRSKKLVRPAAAEALEAIGTDEARAAAKTFRTKSG